MSSRKEVFNKLNETKKLPSPSGTTLRIIQLCHDETASLKEIADVIQVDPALSAELLKYANLFFLSSGIQVVSVQKAAVKLGLRTVVNLALGLSLLSNNKKGKCNVFDYEKFWSISLLQAIAAKNIASAGTEFDREEIFICALLSHMGQLAFASLFPKEYGDILSEFGFDSFGGLDAADDIVAEKPSNIQRKTLEKVQFQIDSSELTVELFLNWGLPAHYALAAGFHDDLSYTELGTGKTQEIAELLNISRQFAEICFHVPPAQSKLDIVEKAAQKFDITEDHFGDVFDTIISQWQEWGETFGIRTHKIQCYNDIMAEKNEEDVTSPSSEK
jgi:two-component system cell cycle response regulator